MNLFSGFLTGSAALGLPSTFRGEEVSSYIQKAKHIILGVEYDITDRITLNAEAYLKYFDQLLNANRNKMYNDNDPAYSEPTINGNPNPFYKPEYLRKSYIIEKGMATGLDISATIDLDHLYVWATYSLGYVERTDETQTYNPHYDRRHTVNLLTTYTFGHQSEWELSGRFTYGTGFPFTQTQGIYQQLPMSDGLSTDYTQENGEYNIYYAELYKGRMPDYHRLDLSVKRRFNLGKRSILDLNASVTNVYSRKNIFYFSRTTFERVNQLPILGSLGVSISF